MSINSTLKVGPFVRAEWQTIHLDQYEESNHDSTSMWFDIPNRDSLVSSLGVRLNSEKKITAYQISPTAEVAWNHEFKHDPLQATAGLTSMGGYFTMSSYVPEKDWGSARLGVNAQLKPNMTAWVNANAIFANQTKENYGVDVGLKYSF